MNTNQNQSMVMRWEMVQMREGSEIFSWKRIVPSGTSPSKRDSHSCSSWRNEIIVIGGERSCDYYLSYVLVLDADILIQRSRRFQAYIIDGKIKSLAPSGRSPS
ncbi:hypothetical protein Pfo_011381 [Paulownia fortunei]|nr:hypothetical protein Pfo_011381 [Paulownia fortunei]